MKGEGRLCGGFILFNVWSSISSFLCSNASKQTSECGDEVAIYMHTYLLLVLVFVVDFMYA